MTLADFQPKCLCIDLETSIGDVLELRKLAAWRADTHQQLVVTNCSRDAAFVGRLDALAEGAAFVLGHNIVRHDLPVLRSLHPQLKLHELPVVDTLELSPIAFPQNPYHNLIKDYKLVSDARSDPLRDAQLALRLWQDQFHALQALQESHPQELACHHFLLARHPGTGPASFFATLRRALAPTAAQVRSDALDLATDKACPAASVAVIEAALADPARHAALAYVLAWLRVCGGNSVLPPWVRLQYPQTREMIRALRETPCGNAGCSYCATYLDPRAELERYFGHRAFRPQPTNASGGSLQEDIVRAAYAGRSLLAILPTGAGKSLCYQLPALSRHWRGGGLTVIISPLQSLMKDQVDNLVRQGIFTAATLNGLLTMPERRDVLERIRLGDVGILLVSPEQFRNRAFVEAIRYREIAAWVFDEAHCLSRWGHDFRPDYLYVSRFIREKLGDARAPLACFTATAKREVIEDLRTHFREALATELAVFAGGHERDNLHYEVLPVTRAEKLPLIHRLLEQELMAAPGGAIVFVARRKSAEEMAAVLKDMGWPCAHFHGGMEAGLKKEVQQAFIAGSLRVIVATNAFGMGVDKPDVRMVIHAEIPGSLENYLQEAGRAGRDRGESRCVLLFDEADVETQFSLAARSRLSRRDIAGILRTLRRYSGKTGCAEIVVTPGEILGEENTETAIDPQNPDADTKVRAAVAWLERARFLQRDENHTRVFPGSLKVGSLEEAGRKLRRAELSAQTTAKYLELLTALVNAPEDEGISTDDLTQQLGVTAVECMRMLQQLESLGVLTNDLALTVLLRKGVRDPSAQRFQRLCVLEKTLLDLLPELAPEAASGDWQDMSLRGVCQLVRERAGEDCLPDQVLTLLRSLARSFGDESGARRAMLEVRKPRAEVLRVRLLRDWSNIREIAQRRRDVAAVLLQALLAKLEPSLQGIDLRVECKLGELTEALKSDMTTGPRLRDELAAINAGLLYLHDNAVLILDRGKTVFRSAMTIRLDPVAKPRRFTVADFAPLKDHYEEKNFQIHVVHEYARLGLRKLTDALAFVLAYFTLPKLDFIRRYFAERREILTRATTEESYQRIVEALRHPLQEQLVSEKPEINRLILAGPGSGKTRVVVHRVGYLVRVLREAASSVLVLTYNRAAAWEIRRRLRALIGADAAGVTVLTYHALALRLTGTSLAVAAERDQAPDFDRIIDNAVALLTGEERADSGTAEADGLRERLLAGYRHILVDEYQDIDARQYALISGLAGRRLADPDAKLTLLAVGDDDQNIYAFRDTSNEFIRRFAQDYDAQTEYLVENYRSSRHIIDAANAVIAQNPERLKSDHPIRINHLRAKLPAGGRWTTLDPVGLGRVHVLGVPIDAAGQAQVAMIEVQRLKALDPESDWSDFAVLARNRATLEPVRAWCEIHGVRYGASDRDQSGQPRLHQTREGHGLLTQLKTKPARRIRPAALLRWCRRRFPATDPSDPWGELLGEFAADVELGWGDTALPRSLALDLLYEFGVEARRRDRGRLILSTVHSAKGREFKHVVMLDGGDWKDPTPEERRLYYVGTSRARETLTLCQGNDRANPFSMSLASEPYLYRTPVPEAIERSPALYRRFVTLGLADVDLSFAGRRWPQSPIHQALAALAYGAPLAITAQEGESLIRTANGTVVGRLARKCQLPEGRVIRAAVESLVYRSRELTDPAYREPLKTAAWWVVLPSLVIEPESAEGL